MGILRYFRQLPRLLQVFWLLALVLLLTSLVVLGSTLLTGIADLSALANGPQSSPLPTDQLSPLPAWGNVGMALAMLGAALGWPSNVYVAHLRRPGHAPWPDAWQMQMLAVLALAALPLCSLAAPLVFPSTNALLASVLFLVQAALNVLEAVLLLAAYVWALAITLR